MKKTTKMEDKLRGSTLQLIEILAREYKEVIFETKNWEFSNLKQKFSDLKLSGQKCTLRIKKNE